nr:hypothetical protein HUO10_001693 [Paraburkholderia busanensis]
MSGKAYNTASSSGGTSNGLGQATTVRLDLSPLSPIDKKVICKAPCVCDRRPDAGASGQALKQQCVSRNLRDVDRSMDWQSPYKAEVNYDMSCEPPAPITRSSNALEPHSYLPGWIQKYWPGGLDRYPAGSGAVRRPDVVIVNDGSLPPTQDNIEKIVEIKFPPQMAGDDDRQMAAYTRIAGSASKVTVLTPDDCDCAQDDGGEHPATSTVSSMLSGLGEKLRQIAISRPQLPGLGLPPPIAPLPLP